MVEGIIYCYTSPSGKKYVGQTRDEVRRRVAFMNLDRSYAGPVFDAARRKYGPVSFKYEVLERVSAPDVKTLSVLLNAAERYWVLHLSSFGGGGYNMNPGGGYPIIVHGPHTAETKARLSEMMRGRYVSEETRRKRSLSLRGSKNPMYGKPLSKETRAKISASLRGRKMSAESTAKRLATVGLRPVKQYTVDGVFVAEHASAPDAARSLGLDASNVWKCCKGRVKSTGGFLFVFSGDEGRVSDMVSKVDRARLRGSKPRRIEVIRVSDGVSLGVFENGLEVRRLPGLSKAHVAMLCSGRQKTYKGVMMRYVDE